MREKQPAFNIEDLNMGLDGKPHGKILIPASRNDIKLWFDMNIFAGGTEIGRTTPIAFFLRHRDKACLGALGIRFDTDRPKHYVVCQRCYRKWEVYKLESMLPNDFSSLFEYTVTPTGSWPYSVNWASDGVQKFLVANKLCTVQRAAQFYYEEFQGFKRNGFKWNSQ